MVVLPQLILLRCLIAAPLDYAAVPWMQVNPEARREKTQLQHIQQQQLGSPISICLRPRVVWHLLKKRIQQQICLTFPGAEHLSPSNPNTMGSTLRVRNVDEAAYVGLLHRSLAPGGLLLMLLPSPLRWVTLWCGVIPVRADS